MPQPGDSLDTPIPVLDGERATIVSVPIPPSKDGRFWVKRGWLSLRIEASSAGYAVSDNVSDVYGCGETFVEALDDYVTELYGHFGQLLDREAVLARGLRADLEALRAVIRVRD